MWRSCLPSGWMPWLGLLCLAMLHGARAVEKQAERCSNRGRARHTLVTCTMRHTLRVKLLLGSTAQRSRAQTAQPQQRHS